MGCNRSLSPDDLQALFVAVERSDTSFLQQALDDGVDPNTFHPERGYLVAVAVDADETGPLKLLIAAGANLNAYDERTSTEPIIIAVLMLKCEHARLLLNAGANPNVRFKNAGELALGDLSNLTAGELYRVQARRFPAVIEKDSACWNEVAKLLN